MKHKIWDPELVFLTHYSWREIFTQVFVVRSLVKDGHSEPGLELGSGEHLPDTLVVMDRHGGDVSKV